MPDLLATLRAAKADVIGNRSRMTRELEKARGVLATSALTDAISKSTQTLKEIDELISEQAERRRLELAVIAASRCIHHWHDHIFPDGAEGMTVSGEHVRDLAG